MTKSFAASILLALSMCLSAQAEPLAPSIETLGRYLQGRVEFDGNHKEFADFVLKSVASSDGLNDAAGIPVWRRISGFIISQRAKAVSEYALISRATNVVDVFEGLKLKNPAGLIVEPYQLEIPSEFNTRLERWLYRFGSYVFRSICDRALDPADFRAMYSYENELRIVLPPK